MVVLAPRKLLLLLLLRRAWILLNNRPPLATITIAKRASCGATRTTTTITCDRHHVTKSYKSATSEVTKCNSTSSSTWLGATRIFLAVFVWRTALGGTLTKISMVCHTDAKCNSHRPPIRRHPEEQGQQCQTLWYRQSTSGLAAEQWLVFGYIRKAIVIAVDEWSVQKDVVLP
jgi:hypothetical protein